MPQRDIVFDYYRIDIVLMSARGGHTEHLPFVKHLQYLLPCLIQLKNILKTLQN